MSETKVWSRPAAVAFGGLAILILIVFAVRKGRGPGDGPGAGSVPARPVGEIVALDPPAEPDRPRVSEIVHTDTSIEFTVNERFDGLVRDVNDTLIFAVPPGRVVRAEVLEYATPAGAAATETPDAQRALRLRDLGVMRRWNLVSLEMLSAFFAPLRRDDPEGTSEMVARIALRWDEAADLTSEPPYPAELAPESAWGRVATRLVANPEGLRLFQQAEPPAKRGVGADPRAAWLGVEGDRPWARVRLTDAGLYQLDLESLIGAGFAAAQATPDAVRVFARGRAIPLLRVGSGAGRRVCFWNDGAHSEFSPERVFWVTVGADLPDPTIEPYAIEAETPAERPTIPRSASIDRDNVMKTEYANIFLSIKRLDWVDAQIKREEPLELALDLPGYAAPETPLEARAHFFIEMGPTVPATNFRVNLDADARRLVALDVSGALRSPPQVLQSFTIAPGLLRAGVNAFSLALDPNVVSPLGAASQFAGVDDPNTSLWFDWLRIDYPSQPILVDGKLAMEEPGEREAALWTPLDEEETRAFAQSLVLQIGPGDEPLGTLATTRRDGRAGLLWRGGGGFRAEARATASIPRTPRAERVRLDDDLIAEDQGFDHLIIAHADFIEDVRPLVQMHQRAGLRTRLVNVQTVYDQFNHGEASPEAIRRLLGYALRHWKRGAPSYALLVGDATSDYLNESRQNLRNFVPSYTMEDQGERWASDYWMTTVAGDDDLGEFMIGRISVNNRDDARAVIEKTIAYAQESEPARWRNRLGYIADKGEFPPAVENLRINHTPRAYDSIRMYLTEETEMIDNWYLPPEIVAPEKLKVSPELTADIIRAFAQGMSVLTFYGHGSPNIYMTERIWFGGDSDNSDNQHLRELGPPAFVINMTCNTGAFDYMMPKWNICISEDMMRVPEGGAIALYVPSGPSTTAVHELMSRQLHRSMFEDGLRGFGEISTTTRVRYSAFGHPAKLEYMYVLLGDPAVDLQLTESPRAFALAREHYLPGERIAATIEGATPDSGRYVAVLETDGGESLAESDEAAFANGMIPLDLTIPEDAPLGKAVVRIYAWNGAARGELAASAPIEVQLPVVEIVNPQVRHQMDRLGPAFSGRLVNKGEVPMVGGRIIARSLDVEGHPIVGEHEFSLAAGEETDFTFGYNIDIGEPRADRTHAYELRIPAPDPTRTEPEAPVDFVTRVAAFNDVMRIGIAPKLSKWEEIEGTQTAMVEAAAIGPLDDGATYSIGIDDAEGGSVRSQIFRLNENDGRATIALDATSRAKAEGGTLWLARMGADPAQPPERISSVAIAELPRPKARLRIAPESVRIAPESVSDGRTLFVQFDVENAGDAAAQRYTAALYDGDPATGGRVLYSHFGNRRIAGRALRPGERERIQLRWDTFESAGERDVWLAIDAGRLKGASTPEDLKLHRPIRVRTKADLKYAETRTQISRLAGERFRYAFTTQVQNAGETDAEFVTVQIYRRNESPPAEPANRLALTQGEMLVESLVERVPANGSVEVQLVWEPDPERYSAELLELIGDKFLAVYQLKGSQQRAAALYRGSRDR